MDNRTENLIKECRRQYDNCKYSSTSLYIWQKHARRWRAVFLVLPILLGGIAASQILNQTPWEGGKYIAAMCTVIAGFFPAIFKALNLDMHLEAIGRSAYEFTNLRDRFRQTANIASHAPFDEFHAAFEVLMDRMDAVRSIAPPVPEWCFKQAQKKIDSGDYDFDVDVNS